MPKGNPNGRPPSMTPRSSNLHVRLSDADREKLEEAARLTGESKTVVICEGIDYVYSKAIAAEKKRQRQEGDTPGEPTTGENNENNIT